MKESDYDEKLYEATLLYNYDLIKYFEDRLLILGIRIVSKSYAISRDKDSVVNYILEAEEGLIESKHEIK